MIIEGRVQGRANPQGMLTIIPKNCSRKKMKSIRTSSKTVIILDKKPSQLSSLRHDMRVVITTDANLLATHIMAVRRDNPPLPFDKKVDEDFTQDQ